MRMLVNLAASCSVLALATGAVARAGEPCQAVPNGGFDLLLRSWTVDDEQVLGDRYQRAFSGGGISAATPDDPVAELYSWVGTRWEPPQHAGGAASGVAHLTQTFVDVQADVLSVDKRGAFFAELHPPGSVGVSFRAEIVDLGTLQTYVHVFYDTTFVAFAPLALDGIVAAGVEEVDLRALGVPAGADLQVRFVTEANGTSGLGDPTPPRYDVTNVGAIFVQVDDVQLCTTTP